MRKRTAAHPTGLAPVTPAAGYWTGAHTLHRLRFHLVWVPKYRKRVLHGPVAARLEALLRQACEVKTWGLHEISVQPDPVHVLLQIAPTDSVMAVMQSLKGGTSRVLRAEFPELEEFLPFFRYGARASGATAISPRAWARPRRPWCARTFATRATRAVWSSARPSRGSRGGRASAPPKGGRTKMGTFRL